jgi:hypothetical protein
MKEEAVEVARKANYARRKQQYARSLRESANFGP